MPVMTFLHDALAYLKGPYYCRLGRYTQTFCKRAENHSKTRIQRKIWFSTAISADEVIASLAGLEKRRTLGALAGWQVQPKADRRRYMKALRAYLSGLLLLYGTCKGELLEVLGLEEQEFMKAWQSIFQYGPSDKAVFDDILTPAFRTQGIDGLATAVGEQIRDTLFQPGTPFGSAESSALQDLMIDDLAALKRHLAKREDKPAEGSPK